MLKNALLALLLSGCAGTAPAQTTAATPTRVATRPPQAVDLDVHDMTRKETWFETELIAELPNHNLKIDHAAKYVVHVHVDQRGSVAGVATERRPIQKGSNRVDSALDEQDTAEYRESPTLETPIYTAPARSRSTTTEAINDFRVAASATITLRGSTAIVASTTFDERALGLQPVARPDRPAEWRVVYRGVATKIGEWLAKQSLP